MNGVAEKITAEIESCGAIPFARFMELALYCPVYGYYEKEEDTIGRAGDYYTSVSVGPLFGELLAFQFAGWLETSAQPQASGSPSAVRCTERAEIVEAGAHRGALACDMFGETNKGFGNAITVVGIVETVALFATIFAAMAI